MLFDTLQYAGFLVTVLALFYLLPFRFGKLALLAASYYFYASWNAPYVLFIVALTLLDYSAARAIARQTSRRRAWLAASICANVAFLGFFKYTNFISGSVLGLFGLPPEQFAIHLLVPLGISFHTFQSIAYIVDVYRGKQKPIDNLPDYALFIAFFPQLIAGPIVRAQTFFPQLFAWRRPTADEVQRGVLLIVLGLVKKMVGADNLARPVNAYFANVGVHPGLLPAWSAAVCFGLQIYFDFSGYTDIAIGSALLFGFELPPNFNRPYFANGIGDFWRRWHMSLSTWLRDYLYIPLGGNRLGRVRTYANLMITMLLGGLWHGAAWHFVAWGAYHGGLLSAQRALGREMPRPLGVPVTFLRVTVGWVLFRAVTIGDAWATFGQMFLPEELGSSILDAGTLALLVVAALAGWIDNRIRFVDRLVPAPVLVRAGALGAMLLALVLFAYTEQSIPFIYFQF